MKAWGVPQNPRWPLKFNRPIALKLEYGISKKPFPGIALRLYLATWLRPQPPRFWPPFLHGHGSAIVPKGGAKKVGLTCSKSSVKSTTSSTKVRSMTERLRGRFSPRLNVFFLALAEYDLAGRYGVAAFEGGGRLAEVERGGFPATDRVRPIDEDGLTDLFLGGRKIGVLDSPGRSSSGTGVALGPSWLIIPRLLGAGPGLAKPPLTGPTGPISTSAVAWSPLPVGACPWVSSLPLSLKAPQAVAVAPMAFGSPCESPPAPESGAGTCGSISTSPFMFEATGIVAASFDPPCRSPLE